MSDEFCYPDIDVIHHSAEHAEHVSRNSLDFFRSFLEVMYGMWPGCIHTIFEVSPQEVVAWVEIGGGPVIVGAMTDESETWEISSEEG